MVLAFADEVIAHPGLLEAFVAEAAAGGPPPQLLLYAPDADPEELEVRLRPLVEAVGLDGWEGPDVVALAVPGSAETEAKLAAAADLLISRRVVQGALAALPRIDASIDGRPCARAVRDAELAEGVVVLGMHRSGTSAVTRVLNLMGLSLGDAADLMAPQPDNPTGFWESSTLVQLNDDLLASLGGSWFAPPPLPPGWVADERLIPLRARARSSFRAVLGAERWLWKDPRTSLTLPFWIDCLGVRPIVVLVVRNPLAVTASLIARSSAAPAGLPQPPPTTRYGLALWERYNRSALLNAQGLPALVTSYDALLADPGDWCEQIRAALAELGVQLGPPPLDEIEAFLDPALRHSVPTAADLARHDEVSEEQRRLFSLLESLFGVHRSLALPPLGPETAWVAPLLGRHRVSEPKLRCQPPAAGGCAVLSPSAATGPRTRPGLVLEMGSSR